MPSSCTRAFWTARQKPVHHENRCRCIRPVPVSSLATPSRGLRLMSDWGMSRRREAFTKAIKSRKLLCNGGQGLTGSAGVHLLRLLSSCSCVGICIGIDGSNSLGHLRRSGHVCADANECGDGGPVTKEPETGQLHGHVRVHTCTEHIQQISRQLSPGPHNFGVANHFGSCNLNSLFKKTSENPNPVIACFMTRAFLADARVRARDRIHYRITTQRLLHSSGRQFAPA